jgi:hypothetical protein
MGSEKWLDIEQWDNTRECFEVLRSRGYRIAVTHVGNDTVSETLIFLHNFVLSDSRLGFLGNPLLFMGKVNSKLYYKEEVRIVHKMGEKKTHTLHYFI